MDFYNKLKSFLGIPSRKRNDNPFNDSSSADILDERDNFNTRPTDDYEQFGFNVFSNPLEMHRYFEHQMNEMMKHFGIFNSDAPFFGNDDSTFGGFQESSPVFKFGFPQFPEEHDLQPGPSDGTLRDNFLKPGYEEPNKSNVKADLDLDEQYRSGDFKRSVVPKQQTPSKSFSFGRSMVSKTITNSDGVIETHKTIHDENGNREETVTRKCGDKEYTVTTRTNRNGLQEITENFVNMDESEKDSFCKNRNHSLQILDKDGSFDQSLFDKFFKQ